MINEIQNLLNAYSDWLRRKTTIRQHDEWVEITTPYLDRHNDYLQIFAKRDNGTFLLSDDGYIISDLELSGCKLESAKRQALLKTTLQGFGIELRDGRLEVRANSEDFALRKHNLLQAMLAVNDLFYLSSPNVSSLFIEDVLTWLEEHDIRFIPKVKFSGKSHLDHLFDVVIPKSRQNPERILQIVNRPSKEAAESIAFKWIDTKEVRDSTSRAYAILNDVDQNISSSVPTALQQYDIRPVLWSKRDEAVNELAA